MTWRRWWFVMRHPRRWRREFRWARENHHGHLHPDSAQWKHHRKHEQ